MCISMVIIPGIRLRHLSVSFILFISHHHCTPGFI